MTVRVIPWPLFLVPIVFLLSDPARAEDRVTLSGGSGIGSIVLTGRVIDWTGETLRFRVGAEDVRELDAGRVESVDTPRTPSHVAGIEAMADGHPEKAAEQFEAALKNEPRQWMRREILAEMVRVDLALGERTAAGRHFLALYESDPETFWFDRLPLDWRIEPTDSDGAGTAWQWTRPSQPEVAQLLGASLLLFADGEEGRVARQRLERLAVNTDARIYPLARAQLWRRKFQEGGVSQGTVDLWLDRLETIPASMRGGPRYLIGHGLADTGDPERAAMNWLWLPLVHHQDPRLAAQAEVLAAAQLTQIGRRGDAIVLYQEVKERFGYTPSADVAREALEALARDEGSGDMDSDS